MIVRTWRARATQAKAAAYREHLEQHVFPTFRSIEGFLGAELLQRRDDDEEDFLVVTRWDSLKAVRAFAGDAFEKAVVAPGAKAVLSSYDDQVSHYAVVLECDP